MAGSQAISQEQAVTREQGAEFKGKSGVKTMFIRVPFRAAFASSGFRPRGFFPWLFYFCNFRLFAAGLYRPAWHFV